MQHLYELKEKLCKELKEYGKKDTLDSTSLEVIDKLAHAIKNIDKIIEDYEKEEDQEYSYAPMPRMPRVSYSRGRGVNARRDSMGRYSSRDGGYSNSDNFRMDMQELMQNAPNERVRQQMMELMNSM